MFVMLTMWCKIQEKNYCKLNFFEKMNPIKGPESPCKKCMDRFFDPYYDILMTWASHFEKAQKSLPIFYL